MVTDGFGFFVSGAITLLTIDFRLLSISSIDQNNMVRKHWFYSNLLVYNTVYNTVTSVKNVSNCMN